MSQGCHLPVSESDGENFKISAPDPLAQEEQCRVVSSLIGLQRDLDDEGVVEWDRPENGLTIQDGQSKVPLSDDEKGRVGQYIDGLAADARSSLHEILNTKTAGQTDTLRALSNPELPREMANALPSALSKIFRVVPEPAGIFSAKPDWLPLNPGPSGTNPSASAWTRDMRKAPKDSAAGHAYEVLATAKMIDKPLKLNDGSSIRVSLGDLLTFGEKHRTATATWYEPPPKHGKVETDVAIYKPVLGGYEMWGIDFKHTSGTVYDSRSEATELNAKLDSIANVLERTPQSHFAFVTNKEFSPDFKQLVRQKNEEIGERLGSRPGGGGWILLAEYWEWR